MRTSAFEVFMLYAPRGANGESKILSLKCFQHWQASRNEAPKEPERAFSKALIGHVRGTQGKKIFPPDIEAIILSELRKPRVWPCFQHSQDPKVRNIGSTGMKQLGHHERLGVLPSKITLYRTQPENCASNVAFFLVNEEYLYRTESVLSTFSDVTPDEVADVLSFKQRVARIFLLHFGQDTLMSTTVVGDVKLLRLLRFHKFNQESAAQQLTSDMLWRKSHCLDDLSRLMIESDFSYEIVRLQTKYFDSGGNFPFFRQVENGDILDYKLLLRQIARSKEHKLGWYHAYAIVAEYRSLVLERISRMRKRVAKHVILFDWKNVKTEHPKDICHTPYRFFGWQQCVSHFEDHIANVIDLFKTRHCRSVDKVYIFGSGTFFSYFAGGIARWVGSDVSNIVHFVANKDARDRILFDYIGPRASWPFHYDKGTENARHTPCVKRKLSLFQ